MNKEIAILFVFESESSPGKTYQALQYVDGTSTCDCPGWRFKRKTLPDGQRTCRHVRDIDAGIARNHAVKVIDYATPAPRPTIRPSVRSRSFEQAELAARQPGRVFDLE